MRWTQLSNCHTSYFTKTPAFFHFSCRNTLSLFLFLFLDYGIGISNWWLTIRFQSTDLFNNTDILKWNLLPTFKILELSYTDFDFCWFFRKSGNTWSFISSEWLWASTEVLSSVSRGRCPVLHHSHQPLSLPTWQSAWFSYHSFQLYPALNH